MNRIDRLTAILIQLQSKRVVKAEEIADRFEISLRTVYRDVKALMEAGVPIGSEAGKGYFIVDGYHLPPVMFTQDEASAMLMAGKLVEKLTDRSVREAFDSSLLKIKAVLSDSGKDQLEELYTHIHVLRVPIEAQRFANHFLTDIQRAIVDRSVLNLEYYSADDNVTKRYVEPIGLFFYSGAWHLIAWCRLREGYRDFRTDRIKTLRCTSDKVDERNMITLQEYLDSVVECNQDVQEVVVMFDQSVVGYVRHMKYYYGFVSEEIQDTKVRMTFLTSNLRSFCRWLMMFGNTSDVVHPEEARDIVGELIDELTAHYGRQTAGLPTAY
jgi:predicted DNA-binding transcriptional regulator YafY